LVLTILTIVGLYNIVSSLIKEFNYGTR